VEGAAAAAIVARTSCPSRFIEDITCRKAQHCDALRSEPGVPMCVMRSTHCVVVAGAVDLHREPHSGTEEIQYVSADGVLPPKPQSVETTAAQVLPEQHLGERHFAAKGSGVLERADRCAHSLPSTAFGSHPLYTCNTSAGAIGKCVYEAANPARCCLQHTHAPRRPRLRQRSPPPPPAAVPLPRCAGEDCARRARTRPPIHSSSKGIVRSRFILNSLLT